MGIDMWCNGGTGRCSLPDSLLWGARTESVEWSTIPERTMTVGSAIAGGLDNGLEQSTCTMPRRGTMVHYGRARGRHGRRFSFGKRPVEANTRGRGTRGKDKQTTNRVRDAHRESGSFCGVDESGGRKRESNRFRDAHRRGQAESNGFRDTPYHVDPKEILTRLCVNKREERGRRDNKQVVLCKV
jgi:hypothetical protein